MSGRWRLLKTIAEHLAGVAGGADDLLAFGGVAGHRFLDQDVLAGLEGGQRDRQVEVVGDGDADGVDVRLGQQLAVVADEVGDVVLLANLGAALGVETGEGHDLGAGFFRPGVGVVGADAAANDTDPKRIHAETCSFR